MAHNSPEIVFYTVEKPVFLEVCEFSKSIPVHARYHSPSMKHSSSDLSALVNLVPPLVYSSCNSKDSCFDENEPSCEWEKMNLSPSLSRTQMSVPVGDLSHSRIVAAVTLLTTIVGTVFLAKEIWTIIEYKMLCIAKNVTVIEWWFGEHLTQTCQYFYIVWWPDGCEWMGATDCWKWKMEE